MIDSSVTVNSPVNSLIGSWSRLKQEGRFRAIDLQVGVQIANWEAAPGSVEEGFEDDSDLHALLGCLVSYVISTGQVSLPLNQAPLVELASDWLSTEEWLQVIQRMASVWACEDYSPQNSVPASDTDSDAGWRGQPLVLEIAPDGIPRLYLARYYFYQSDVIRQVHARCDFEIPSAERLNQIRTLLWKFFPDAKSFCENGEIDRQALAAVTAILQPVTLIVGGPGTGKTTTITRLMAMLLSIDPDLRIAMAAPTGKAAARMTESVRQAKTRLPNDCSIQIPEQASTLHRLLGWGSGGFTYHSERPLAVDCLIIDEASMIDLPMMRQLLEALPRQAKLILLGDRNQLSSVEAGSVLADLSGPGSVKSGDGYFKFVESLFSCTAEEDVYSSLTSCNRPSAPLARSVVELLVSRRFSDKSGIGVLSGSIQIGDYKGSLRDLKSDRFHDLVMIESYQETDTFRTELSPEVIEPMWELYRGYLDQVRSAVDEQSYGDLFEHFNRFRVLVAVRKGLMGLLAVNAAIEARFRQSLGVSQKSGIWYPGRPVMIKENDYDLGLFNGDIGICVRMADGSTRVLFQGENGEIRSISPGRLPANETCFAITVHKSQGSEFDQVMLVLPYKWSPIVSRELIYTAVTRAKVEFRLVTATEVWIKAVQSRATVGSALGQHLWLKS